MGSMKKELYQELKTKKHLRLFYGIMAYDKFNEEFLKQHLKLDAVRQTLKTNARKVLKASDYKITFTDGSNIYYKDIVSTKKIELDGLVIYITNLSDITTAIYIF